jgi:hypothetical protein
MSLFVRADKFGFNEANKLKKLGYGDGSAMGDKEVRVVAEGGDFVLKIQDGATLKTVEKTRSQERTYHGQAVLDDNTPLTIPFHVFSTATSVKIKLWGVGFPGYHYTELPAHDHGAAAFASSTHTHTTASHRHTLGVISLATAGSHNHGGETGNTNSAAITGGYISQVHPISTQAAHTHVVTQPEDTGWSGVLTTAAPSATAAIPSAGISGGLTLNDTAKTLVDTLIQLYITAVQGTWGTANDKDTVTPVDFSSLVDINANGGTAEIDIFTLVTVDSFNYLRLVEPTAKKGGTILWHISIA